jgi:hypothetical protein
MVIARIIDTSLFNVCNTSLDSSRANDAYSVNATMLVTRRNTRGILDITPQLLEELIAITKKLPASAEGLGPLPRD